MTAGEELLNDAENLLKEHGERPLTVEEFFLANAKMLDAFARAGKRIEALESALRAISTMGDAR